MRRGRAVGASLLCSSLALACAPADRAALAPGEDRPAGAATTSASLAAGVLAQPVSGLSAEQRQIFVLGESFEEHAWVTAPSSTSGRDGLGPLFNASRCTACHLNASRGRPAGSGEEMLSTLVRLSVPGSDEHGAPLPEPTYGGQLSPRAIVGVAPEAATRTSWIESTAELADGTLVSLRAPRVEIVSLAYGPFAEGTMTSVRVAQPLVGLGLLEAIPDEALRANADPDDLDHDGVSGRASEVWDPREGRVRLGRFGWKATTPDLQTQTAAALSGDIGITSSYAPDESCTAAQTSCSEAPRDEGLQASDAIVDAIAFYQRALGVPARRGADDPSVLRGRALFRDAGCASCHVPSFTTGPSELAAIDHQRIWPYTDLLLHDMGEELADHRPDHTATGLEWRTPALWGLGLADVADGPAFLLHDGRARDVVEAILWHGGEADAAREAFAAMSAADRDALVVFVRSL